jgi:uncharacterized membrane protein
MSFPEPLHPAIVHFPIALILLGTVAAVATLVFPRAALAWFSAGILAFASVGALAATWSGDEDEEKAEHAGAGVERILEEHEEWAERSRNAAIIAMLAAGGAAISLKRLPVFSRAAAAITAAVAFGASWCVLEAGHYGGQLVYQHGVGVSRSGPAAFENTTQHENQRHHDDD